MCIRDRLSAIKYAKVKVIRDEDGIATDFEIDGEFPRYGNNDERAEEIAVHLLRKFMSKIRYCHTYSDSAPTTSILTITSNVVYGKATGCLLYNLDVYKSQERVCRFLQFIQPARIKNMTLLTAVQRITCL